MVGMTHLLGSADPVRASPLVATIIYLHPGGVETRPFPQTSRLLPKKNRHGALPYPGRRRAGNNRTVTPIR